MYRTIRWRVAVPYIVLITVAMAGLLVYLTRHVRTVQLADLADKLAASAACAAPRARALGA